jgi:hypothetical protein
MVEKITHVKNPLTIIAIFAGLAEVFSTAVTPFLSVEIQYIFIWFLVSFPLILIGLFFITLNFNHKVLYAPSDYKDEQHFISILRPATKQEKENKLKEEIQEDIEINTIEEIQEEVSECIAEEIQKRIEEQNFGIKYRHYKVAEKAVLNKIQKEKNIDIHKQVSFDYSNGSTMFDGISYKGQMLNIYEVKILNDNIQYKEIIDNLIHRLSTFIKLSKFDAKNIKLDIVFLYDRQMKNIEIMKKQIIIFVKDIEKTFEIEVSFYNLETIMKEIKTQKIEPKD